MTAAASPSPLILQIVGYKNTGKTTLVCRLTERFKQAGYIVGTIKHDAHDFQMDTPGTDTWKHQAAGADITAISSSTRTAIIKRQAEPLEQLIARMPEASIILIEGFKAADYPKIITIRSAGDFELLDRLTHPIAAAVWPEAIAGSEEAASIPIIDINQVDQLFQTALTVFPLPTDQA